MPMTDDEMIRDSWVAAVYVVWLLAVVVPAAIIVMKITRMVEWIDARLPGSIGAPWYRFAEWYFGELVKILPDIDTAAGGDSESDSTDA